MFLQTNFRKNSAKNHMVDITLGLLEQNYTQGNLGIQEA
jgi:hypothetical protein